jgi:hypothetical protein
MDARRIMSEGQIDDLVAFLTPPTIIVPNVAYLPRRWKKIWRKVLADRGRLTAREWRIADMLSSRRRSRVRYLRFPLVLTAHGLSLHKPEGRRD